MEKQKKQTNAQLQKRIERAVLHIDRTKATRSIYFDDKGLRITADDDYVVIETGYHRHVFSSFTASGASRPYLYVNQLLSIALDNLSLMEVQKDNGTKGYSFSKLLNALKEDSSKQKDYIIVYYCDMYLFTIFQNLYLIGETEANTFLVYMSYICGIALNAVTLEEHKEGLTNHSFFKKFLSVLTDLTQGTEEREIFPKKTDEEKMQEEIDAIQSLENEEIINGHI